MSSKNPEIQGFMVLERIGGKEGAKSYIVKDKPNVKFDINNYLHVFILASVTRRFRSTDYEMYKTPLEEYGLKATKPQLKKCEEIIRRVIVRSGLKEIDPLEENREQRRFYRRRLFTKRVLKEVKGSKILRHKKGVATAEILVTSKGVKNRYKFYIKNGIVIKESMDNV